MRGEAHKEPPPDVEFPYFKVVYYDQPESAGIRFKTTDARSSRWPDPSKSFHSDGSINIWQAADEDVQYNWRQKLGELLTGSFLLVDEDLSGTICTPLTLAPLIRIPVGLPFLQRISSR